MMATRAAAAGASAATRFRSAVRKLSKDGVDALRPQLTVISHGEGVAEERKWKKPAISRRVARVLRKDAIKMGLYGSFDAEKGTGWDPKWDEALASRSAAQSQASQGRYRITVPKTTKRERTREQRAQKIEKKMEGMDDRIEEHYQSKQDAKPPQTFENYYKKLMRGN